MAPYTLTLPATWPTVYLPTFHPAVFVAYRIQFKLLVLMHGAIHANAPRYLADRVSAYVPSRSLVAYRIQFKLLTLVHGAIHANTPRYLADRVSAYVPSRSLRCL